MGKTVGSSFGAIAAAWDKKIGNGKKGGSENTVKAVFELLGNLKNKKVYDIACGNGFLARTLVEKGTGEIWASDVSPELIAIAREKYSSKDIRYSVRDAIDFKAIPKNYFDAVVIHQGMFYIKDIESLVKGVAKILKPKGMLIFSLIHPLFSSARQSIGEDIDALEVQKDYLKIHSKIISRVWDKDRVSYLTFKRPLSHYINACGRHGLLVESIVESKSIFQKDGKIARSDIPGSMIIKTMKVL